MWKHFTLNHAKLAFHLHLNEALEMHDRTILIRRIVNKHYIHFHHLSNNIYIYIPKKGMQIFTVSNLQILENEFSM